MAVCSQESCDSLIKSCTLSWGYKEQRPEIVQYNTFCLLERTMSCEIHSYFPSGHLHRLTPPHQHQGTLGSAMYMYMYIDGYTCTLYADLVHTVYVHVCTVGRFINARV